MARSSIADAIFRTDYSGPDALRWKKRKVLTALRQTFGMDVAFISRFAGSARVFDEVEMVPGLVIPGLERGGSGPAAQSYCYRVYTQAIPAVIPDSRAEPGVQDIAATQDLPVGAHISVPIRLSDDRVFGMLCAFSRKPDTTLSERDRAIFDLCAALLARDIEAEVGEAQDEGLEAISAAIRAGDWISLVQPIMDLATLQTVGFELFSRFAPELGSTAEVFRKARNLDLVVPLEELVLSRVGPVLREIPGDRFLAVNLAAETLLELDLATTFAGVDPHRVVLELTEHEAVEDYGPLAARVAAAQAAGFRVAIDDVGAGYASLRHLLLLKPDIVKIDRSLIAGLDSNPAQASFVTALRDYAKRRGAEIIAEGIEREEERQNILAAGSCWGQGYLLGRPRALVLDPETAPRARRS